MTTQLKKYGLILLLILFLLVIIWSWFILRNPKIFPIKNVVIKATYQHVNPQTIQQIITPYTTSSFFSLNVKGLKQDLLNLPWVYAANINKVWPDGIIVQITEQQPVATWNKAALLTPDLKIFTPNPETIPHSLPQLAAPNNDQVEKVWHYYQQMNKTLASINLTITKLDLSPNNNWHLLLSNGINLYLGDVNVLQRLQLFVTAYPKVVGGKADQVKIVDLRYDRGLAVEWKK